MNPMEPGNTLAPQGLWRWLGGAVLLSAPLAVALTIPLDAAGKRNLNLTPFLPLTLLASVWLLGLWWRRGCLGRALYAYLQRSWPALLVVAASAVSLTQADFGIAQSKALAAKTLVQLLLYLVLAPLVLWAWLMGDPSGRARHRVLLTSGGVVLLSVLVQAIRIHVELSVSAFPLGGILLNRNTYALALGLLLPPILAGLGGKPWSRVVAPVVGMVTALLLTTAGGPVLGALVGLALMAAGEAGVIRRAACAVLLIASLVWLVGHPVAGLGRIPLLDSVQVYVGHEDRETGAQGYEHTMRYYRWSANLEMMRECPWLGVGLGQYGKRVGEYYGPIAIPEGRSDAVADFNVKTHEPFTFGWFFVTAAETGAVGMLSLLVLMGSVVAGAVRGIRAHRAMGVAILAMAIGLFVAGWFTNVWVRGTGGLFALMLALSWVQTNEHPTSNTEHEGLGSHVRKNVEVQE
ncbi:MAG: O-antigen ligase family protein [Planctomycetota bacterium]|jgi:hypothetical protein